MEQLKMFDELDTAAEESSDDVIVQLDEFHQAVIWGTDWTTGTIVNQLNKGNIDLNPRFQRREAWTEPRKSKFIESLILGLPIPQIILAEKKERKGTYIVIDGKQRLLSIRKFFSQPDEVEFPRLRLSKLDSLSTLNGKSYYDLDNDPALSDFAIAIENQSVRTIIIKNWPSEAFLYNVFLRLNTGSLQLSPQELRQALNPGDFIDFADDFSISSEHIKRVLNIRKPDYRMRDVELVIRYFAFKLFADTYNGNLKLFFDNAVQTLNSEWLHKEAEIQQYAKALESAIEFTYEIWSNDAFRKWKAKSYQGRFNRAIFDIMVYYFSDPHIRHAAANHKPEIKERFRSLCEGNVEFLNSFETSTKNMIPTNIRYEVWGRALGEIIGIPANTPNFKVQKN